METKTQHGYLVLADISGYTSYLAGTELEHSQEVLSELLELILRRLTPTLTLSKLEGDAVFAYAPEARFTRGEALLELVEATYVAFKDRLEGIRRRTTCECNACRQIPQLDLKFMTHYGDYFVQNVAGINELVGSDVNLVHRLLKNHVAETTGWRAYALFTEKGLERMGLRPDALRAHPQPEAYEHLGEVLTHTLNLHDRYQAITEARRVFLGADEADLVLTHDFAAPPPVVWDWLNDPYKRTQWMYERVWSITARPAGRTGVGARNHCEHGKGTIHETILDWRPFDYVTVEQQQGNLVMTETVQFEPLPEGRGTRVHTHIRVPTGLPPLLNRPLVKLIVTRIVRYKNDEVFAKLARLMADEQAAVETAEVTGAATGTPITG
jgi:uncharacterized protein YndB with AHSA1/START domain